jgi:hypothetical protein
MNNRFLMVVVVAAGLLTAGAAHADAAVTDTLFVDTILATYEISPGGGRSVFASGLDQSEGLAFDSRGDLFEADWGTGNIYEFMPGGTKSTFATELYGSTGLAIAPVPEPSTITLRLSSAACLLAFAWRQRRGLTFGRV